jgi:tetratricopeptide (TPR) repeat protein
MKTFASQVRAALPLLLLLTVAITLGIVLDTAAGSRPGIERRRKGDLLETLLGDGRRIFANHFFVKADVYFHSGYYPTVFDNREAFQTAHMAEDAGVAASRNTGDEREFLGAPRDWIERFGRNFFASSHTHLDEGGAGAANENDRTREILPWLKIAATLNPEDVRTYTVAAYWLRERMGKTAEAEQVLRDGLRANPDSPDLYVELGRLVWEERKDAAHARNLWELGLRKWEKVELPKKEPDIFPLQNLLLNLGTLEAHQGNYDQAIAHFQKLLRFVNERETILERIKEWETARAGLTAGK